jgi:hypothetical protein
MDQRPSLLKDDAVGVCEWANCVVIPKSRKQQRSFFMIVPFMVFEIVGVLHRRNACSLYCELDANVRERTEATKPLKIERLRVRDAFGEKTSPDKTVAHHAATKYNGLNTITARCRHATLRRFA